MLYLNVYETGKIQITTLHPYDDAEYHWALSNDGKNFKIILNKKVVGNISVTGDLDNKLDLVSKELAKRNKDIKSKMMYESEFLKEDWRDGNFSEADMKRYLEGIKQDFGRIMFSLENMIQKYPQYTPQFRNTLNGFRDYIESFIDVK